MSLIKVNELLKHATKHRYGVPAINVINYETIRCAIQAAEHENMPIIIQFFPGLDKYIATDYIAYMAKDMAHKASVPVALHLDHSVSFEIAVSGIRAGYPSVMVDGSALPYEENVALTSAVVRIADVFDIDIEAELGHVGIGAKLEDMTNTDFFTNVEQAVDFVERTKCGSLAIAVGNAHGAYIQKPNLDFKRIEELRAAVSVPLVMHGGSGIPDEQLQRAVQLGMSKFNIATEYFAAMYTSLDNVIDATEHKPDGLRLLLGMKQELTDYVIGKIRMLNPNGYSLKEA